MCLGTPRRVLAVDQDGAAAAVDGAGPAARVSLLALDGPVDVGDWVLVHAGFAVQRLGAEEGAAIAALIAAAEEER